jgi:hypothetical protein
MLYKCEICSEEYTTEKECLECESRKLDRPKLAVGDIVSIRFGYGWYDGDRDWVINPEKEFTKRGGTCPTSGDGNCFGECCTMGFYYVITKISHEQHRVKYHVFTKAMTGKQGHHEGYTYEEMHYTPTLVPNPPKKVVSSSKDLIGKESDYLL